MDRHVSSQNSSFLELKDLSIASFLLASEQVNLIGKRKLPSGEILFQFSPKEVAEQLVKAYWSLNAPIIQPKKLFSAQRDLKDMIFGS